MVNAERNLKAVEDIKKFDTLERKFSECNECLISLVTRASKFVNRMAGEQPQTGATSKAGSQPDSILGILTGRAEVYEANLKDLCELIERMEQL